MKKVLILLAMFLVSVSGYSQEFNKWSIDIEGGIHSVNDESAVNINNEYHFGAGARFNFNPTFGLGISLGHDELDLKSLENVSVNTKVQTASVEGTVNMFRILNLYSKNWNILAHGGVGASFIDGSYKYDETLLSTRAGLTGLLKLGKRVALKADYSITSYISQNKTLDGLYDNNNYGITSTLHTMSAGLVFYLGKKGREHADWYQYTDVAPTVINNNPTTIVKETVTIKEEAICNCDTQPESEYVFFDHDKFDIRNSELNTVYKVYATIRDNANYTLDIKGWASPTKSSAAYNQALSERRSNELWMKFEKMGLDMSRVDVVSSGKDLARKDEAVHDVARRVELIITKTN